MSPSPHQIKARICLGLIPVFGGAIWLIAFNAYDKYSSSQHWDIFAGLFFVSMIAVVDNLENFMDSVPIWGWGVGGFALAAFLPLSVLLAVWGVFIISGILCALSFSAFLPDTESETVAVPTHDLA